jgi:hypothetical protein
MDQNSVRQYDDKEVLKKYQGMNPITSTKELKDAIAALELKTKTSGVTLKGQIQQSKVALKPQNVLRNTFSSIGETPEIRKVLISTVIGMAFGYFSKKAKEMLTEENMNRFMAGLVDRGVHEIQQRYPHPLVSKGLEVTRNVAREKGLRFF